MTEFEELIQKKIDDGSRCPICGVLQDKEFDLLCSLQYTVTNNQTLRKEITSEGGFCEHHFRQFRKIADGVTNALLLLDLTKEYDPKTFLNIQCRLCKQLNEYEINILNHFLSVIHQSEFQNYYVKGPGFCFKHVNKILKGRINNKIKDWLMIHLQRQIKNDRAALHQMTVKSYYETTPHERGSIPRSIERIAGYRALDV